MADQAKAKAKAKAKTSATDGPTPDVLEESAAPAWEQNEPQVIVLRDDRRVGENVMPKGTVLGEITTHGDCGLNYLVDAIRGGIAGVQAE